MKNIIFIFFSLLFSSFISAQNNNICGSNEKRIKEIGEENMNVYFENEKEKMSNWEGQHTAQERTLITIPVIFHVVWREEEENISTAQILSQLEVINQDFRALNDQSNVQSGFLDDVADFEIEFCLATRKPDNTSTSGIIRTQTEETLIGIKDELYEVSPAISPLHYINIWIADCGTLNGIASFPFNAGNFDDGIVLNPHVVGTIGTAENSEPYHLGRTLTHELGHYFNLEHVFGNFLPPTCSADDGVDDTPSTSSTYIGECPEGIVFTCDTPDMWMNFMYYTDDACMSMFTNGQKERVLATLANERFGLTISEGCLPPLGINSLKKEILLFNVSPNIVSDFTVIEINIWEQETILSLYSSSGQLVRQLKLGEERTLLDFSQLNKGLYFLKLENKDAIGFQKLVIQ